MLRQASEPSARPLDLNAPVPQGNQLCRPIPVTLGILDYGAGGRHVRLAAYGPAFTWSQS